MERVCPRALRHFSVLEVGGEAGGGEVQFFGREGVKDSFFGHDDAVAFVEEVIGAKFTGGEVDGDEVGACAQASPIAIGTFGEVEGADGGDDPMRAHQAQSGHAVEGEIDGGGGVMGEGSFIPGNEWADTASIEGQFGGQVKVGHEFGFGLAGESSDETGTDGPSCLSEVVDVLEALLEGARALQFFVSPGMAGFELDDVDRGTAFPQGVVGGLGE